MTDAPRIYYQDATVTLWHGRCEDVLDSTPDSAYPLVFTSPPYNMNLSYDHAGNAKKVSRGSKGARFYGGYGAHEDTMPPEEYRDWQRCVLRDLWRVTADRGAVFYNHKPRIVKGELQTPLVFNPGLPLRQIVIWDRMGGAISLGDGHFAGEHEWLLVFAKQGFRLVDRGASAIGDVWRLGYETRDYGHPAPFPVALPARAIRATGAPLVFDPFAGTGTTLAAAKLLGAKAVGVEREERWCEVAARRLAQQALPLEAVS